MTLSRRAVFFAAVCGLATAIHAVTYLPAGPVDDDYILYRYASNLLNGQGLVYNPGERVEGFTSPLCVFLYAFGMLLRIDPWVFSQALSILACALAGYAVSMAWTSRHASSRWPVPGLLVAASPALAYHSAAGLGTTLLAGLIVLWAWRYSVEVQGESQTEGKRLSIIALLIGVAGLVRAEAVFFALPYGLVEWRKRRRWSAVLALGPLIGWSLFRLAYYGALLPVTYHVKKLPFLVDLGYGVRYFWRATELTGIGVAVVLAASLLRHRDESRALRCCAVGLVAYTLFIVYVGGDYMSFARFFVPVLPLGFWLATEAVATLPLTSRLGTAIVVLASIFLLWPREERQDVFSSHEQLEERWIRIGRTLNRAAAPEQSLALAPVGAIGYFSKLKVIDMLGMTNDVVWRTPPDLSIDIMKGHQRYCDDWVIAQQPDIVLLGDGLFVKETNSIPLFTYERNLFDDRRFKSSYHSMAMAIPESYPLVFFLRNGSQPPVGSSPIGRR